MSELAWWWIPLLFSLGQFSILLLLLVSGGRAPWHHCVVEDLPDMEQVEHGPIFSKDAMVFVPSPLDNVRLGYDLPEKRDA